MSQPTVFLIPVPISEGMFQTLSSQVLAKTLELTHYFAEDLRTARRFVKAIHPQMVIESLFFEPIDKHDGADMNLFKKWLREGKDIGIMSESGCPGIADPGAELVNLAHNMNARVVPLVGPSAILLAVMASGLSGQQFAFNGYLPVKDPNRSQKIKELEAASLRNKTTQVFIETPYRNNHLVNDILRNCSPYSKLSIALDITGPSEWIKTKTIGDWKKNLPTLDKLPTVFSLLAFS